MSDNKIFTTKFEIATKILQIPFSLLVTSSNIIYKNQFMTTFQAHSNSINYVTQPYILRFNQS